MVKTRVIRSLLCGAVAIAGTFAMLQPVEAGPVRVRFTPPYGTPFPNLEWYGEAVIDDGGCVASGNVSNLIGTCAGEFTITSATVYFEQITPSLSDPGAIGRIDFTGGQIISVNRDSPDPTDWNSIISTPFNPAQVPGDLSQTRYGSEQAYFSLVFIGGYAQLYWFQNDPGDPLLNPLSFPYVDFASAPYYLLCYQEGDNRVGGLLIPANRCGISGNVGGESGALSFAAVTAVPEPGTLALLFAAGLGAAAGLRTRRRNT